MGVLVPRSLDAAVAALADHADALILAGGTDLMVEVNESRHRFAEGDTSSPSTASPSCAAGPTIRRRAPSASAPA